MLHIIYSTEYSYFTLQIIHYTLLHTHSYNFLGNALQYMPFTKGTAVWTSFQDPNICNNVL